MELFSKSLDNLKIQPVGDGFIDLICPPEHIEAFIDLCNEHRMIIKGFTWWCHVTEGHKACGMGGPKSEYYDGWFSEMPMNEIIKLSDNVSWESYVANNENYRNYFVNEWPKEENYSDCHWPGFWLEEYFCLLEN